MKKSWGVSLLEILLVTVVAAAACVVSIRLYVHSKEKAEVLQAESQVSRLVEASHQWLVSNRAADYSTWTRDIMDDLVNAGLLQEGDKTNPWGGAVTASGTEVGALEIEFTDIADAGCSQLSSRFSAMATTSCKENVWSATF